MIPDKDARELEFLIGDARYRAIQHKMRLARHNANRQRRREEAGLTVFTSSSFWERVESDYLRELRDLAAKAKA